FQAEDGIRDRNVTGVQTCALPILASYLLNTNDNSNDLGKLAHEHGYDDVQTDEEVYGKGAKRTIPDDDQLFFQHLANKARAIERSEERRVGKEGRARW